MPWDPERYHQFQAERFAPFDDLLALIDVRPGLRVVDLGCGTGDLTRRLADALAGSDVLGIDRSPSMLERAAAHARPGLRFARSDIEAAAGTWDLVFSHAALQWVDDHIHLIPRLMGLLSSGGQLAVQLPSNHTHAAHTSIGETAAEEPFCSALRGWQRTSPVLPIETYAALLFEAGATDITVYEKVYPHVMQDADAIADWTWGTALVPYMDRLPEELHAPFMKAYRARLSVLWPSDPIFYPFRRTLFAARRSR